MTKPGESQTQSWIIGITGASGSPYAIKLCQTLLGFGCHLHLVITDAGWRVLREEMRWHSSGNKAKLDKAFADQPGTWEVHPLSDIGASIASGTYLVNGMVIVPCSMGSLAAIAHGLSDNLLRRAADCTLKEQRKLILVPRETPLSVIHLQNMLSLARAGALMLPAMPAFYTHPDSLEQVVDFMTAKILDAMGVPHNLISRWGSGT